MLQITDKSKCCGCNACVQRCPKQCIVMHEDEEGFLYPQVDVTLCIDCGLCEKVCPVLNQNQERKPLKVYAAINKDERIRMLSSSGGLFTVLAEQILKEGGVVFGARFNDDWEVVHDYTETFEGLARFRGSKYVQSYVGNTFCLVEQFLKQKRKVLYSGTPCQVAGLRLFLHKEYENLLTVDIVCHGVPSPGVWRKYLKETCTRVNQSVKVINSLSFRDKCTGWKGYSFSISFLDGQKIVHYHDKELWMKGFLSDLYIRPSCYACPSKCLKSGSDITLGDYWGIQNVMPKVDDDKGVCCFLINTEKGKGIQDLIDFERIESQFADVVKGNPSMIHSVIISSKRIRFFRALKNKNVSQVISLYTKQSIILRLKIFIYNLLKRNCKL